MGKKKKYYVVWKGHKPGIYHRWEDCKAAVAGYTGAQFKSFLSFEEAQKAFNGKYNDYKKQKNSKTPSPAQLAKRANSVNPNAIAVDAASSGNPGKMEYRGVILPSEKELFRIGPFEQGTNNIGEFLAIVHGLAFLKLQKSNRIIYSDSQIAIGWIKKKKCNTKLAKTSKNAELFKLISRAEEWLQKNTYTTPVVKWETKAWGEIPADFGRK